jgi:hypothetical protein
LETPTNDITAAGSGLLPGQQEAARHTLPCPHLQICPERQSRSEPDHPRSAQPPGQGQGCPTTATTPLRRPPAPGPSTARQRRGAPTAPRQRWREAALAAAQPAPAVGAWRALLSRLAERAGTGQWPALWVIAARAAKRGWLDGLWQPGRASVRWFDNRQCADQTCGGSKWWLWVMGIQPASPVTWRPRPPPTAQRCGVMSCGGG